MNDPCQLQRLPHMAEGQAAQRSLSLAWRLKLWVKRRLTPEQKRAIKRRIAQGLGRIKQSGGPDPAPPVPSSPDSGISLQAGDRVRVRDWESIQATLSMWHDLRGCVFMEEMRQYCETEQRVLKPVTQFLDERDYRIKRCRGIILLEGAICQGLRAYGRCDRSCFYFWRTEWLEKIE